MVTTLGDISSLRSTAQRLERDGHIEAAVAAWSSVLKHEPGDLEGVARLAGLSGDSDAERHGSARADVNDVRSTRAMAWADLARALDRLADHDGAIDAWRKHLLVQPDAPEAHERLYALYYDGGQLAQAGPHLRVLAMQSPENWKLWRRLAFCLEAAGDAAGEAEALTRALAAGRVPDASICHQRLASFHFDKGNLAEAIPHLRSAVALSSADWKLWSRLAACLQATGDLAGEAEALFKCLELNDARSKAHGRLAVALARLGRDRDAVFHLVGAAGPEMPFSRAWKDFGQALRELEGLERASRIQARLIAVKDDRGGSVVEQQFYPITNSTTAVPKLPDRRAKVSVGLPAYNDERHIGHAIESLLNQDYKNFEIIFIDNDSSDGTYDIASSYASNDGRIVIRRNPSNIGARANFNRVFELADGEYFLWASSHDVWEPNFISKLVAALESEPSAVVAYSHLRQIDEEGRPFGYLAPSFDSPGAGPRQRLRDAVLQIRDAGLMSVGLHRRSALAKTPRLRPCLMPDRLLMLEYSVEGAFIEVPELLWNRRFDFTRPKMERRDAARAQQVALFAPGRRRPFIQLITLSHCAWLAYDLGLRRLLRDPLSAWWGPYAAYLYWSRWRREAGQEWRSFVEGIGLRKRRV